MANVKGCGQKMKEGMLKLQVTSDSQHWVVYTLNIFERQQIKSRLPTVGYSKIRFQLQ